MLSRQPPALGGNSLRQGQEKAAAGLPGLSRPQLPHRGRTSQCLSRTLDLGQGSQTESAQVD